MKGTSSTQKHCNFILNPILEHKHLFHFEFFRCRTRCAMLRYVSCLKAWHDVWGIRTAANKSMLWSSVWKKCNRFGLQVPKEFPNWNYRKAWLKILHLNAISLLLLMPFRAIIIRRATRAVLALFTFYRDRIIFLHLLSLKTLAAWQKSRTFSKTKFLSCWSSFSFTTKIFEI